ncbi:hypothetical protein AKJ40_01605 [candidate division MSBL1 archaeon SCGC-AAA259M10]|uniref:FAD-binding PCMH-type domain-containing protein n=3 Tax=candidate division MSBL1 TaxID=215777 RepID=A0A133V1C8_9EURY|nr:hypothetical protein AKJ40_01605 [candidate division MSBL1 archaeon SCGC-AAA259M10]
MKRKVIEKLESIVGSDWVVVEEDQMQDYLIDETPEPVRPKPNPDVVVVKPEGVQEISEILKLANQESVPVVPRGGGTGLCGAAIPTKPSIILSLERLDDIIEIDRDNFTITCEAGVTLEKLLEELEETDDLFFPPHPGDEGAQVGGLVIENAGGARAVKYGVIRNFVKGLEIVLPTGEAMELGGKIIKNNTGLDLLDLVIGSEGILGIVTKVTFRLYPTPKERVSLVVPYGDRHSAVDTVPDMLREGLTPLSIEYMEEDLIERACEHLGEKWPVKTRGSAYLYIIVTGNDEEEAFSQCEKIGNICQEHGALDVVIADRRREQEKILNIRSNIYTALKPDSVDILDVTVPPAEIGKLMDEIEKIGEKYETYIPAYGHVADGNVHPHIMKEDGKTPPYMESMKEEIYSKTKELGGVITGEHGIGKTRIKNLPQAVGSKYIDLMKKIRKVFDPNNILNPGTVVEDD